MSAAPDPAWLARLHDIAEPTSPALWPPSPGWWLVAALALLLLLRGGQWGWQRWRATAYRRQALRALAQCDGKDAAQSVATCLRLLRHATQSLSSPPESAAWVDWLHTRCPGLTASLRVQQLLREGAYCPPQRLSSDDAAALRAFVRRWLQEHRA